MLPTVSALSMQMTRIFFHCGSAKAIATVPGLGCFIASSFGMSIGASFFGWATVKACVVAVSLAWKIAVGNSIAKAWWWHCLSHAQMVTVEGRIAASAARKAATSLILQVRSILIVIGLLRILVQTNRWTTTGSNVHLMAMHSGSWWSKGTSTSSIWMDLNNALVACGRNPRMTSHSIMKGLTHPINDHVRCSCVMENGIVPNCSCILPFSHALLTSKGIANVVSSSNPPTLILWVAMNESVAAPCCWRSSQLSSIGVFGAWMSSLGDGSSISVGVITSMSSILNLSVGVISPPCWSPNLDWGVSILFTFMHWSSSFGTLYSSNGLFTCEGMQLMGSRYMYSPSCVICTWNCCNLYRFLLIRHMISDNVSACGWNGLSLPSATCKRKQWNAACGSVSAFPTARHASLNCRGNMVSLEKAMAHNTSKGAMYLKPVWHGTTNANKPLRLNWCSGRQCWYPCKAMIVGTHIFMVLTLNMKISCSVLFRFSTVLCLGGKKSNLDMALIASCDGSNSVISHGWKCSCTQFAANMDVWRPIPGAGHGIFMSFAFWIWWSKSSMLCGTSAINHLLRCIGHIGSAGWTPAKMIFHPCSRMVFLMTL